LTVKYLKSLRESSLFVGIDEKELKKMLNCLSIREKTVEQESFIFRAGDDVRNVYYILSGSVHIVSEDFWGNRSIIETMYSDTLFGEAYFFAETGTQLVSVIAAEDSVILEISPDTLFEMCSKVCVCHSRLIRNVASILSRKIVRLTEKMEHVIRRSIREKIISYLSQCAQLEKKSNFTIPYSRQQLADYLCVDRSALSHELSKLKAEGIIDYQKNFFKLI
jgi:cAMP-binding proteins - catabolite gene activator and regulatory subunit of cAMP-dependent protein kinases